MAFQQGKVSSRAVGERLSRVTNERRRTVITETVADAAGGAHSLPELDFLQLSRSAGLPEPKLQYLRRDATGRRRYLDAYYEKYGVHVEIDGVQHADPFLQWKDMERQNHLWIKGDRVLRFPAWLVRERPHDVIAQVRAALIAAGWLP
jgi:very-short-patch-repair endonuclease